MNPGLFLTTITPDVSGNDTGSLPPSGFAAQNAATSGNWLQADDPTILAITKDDTFIIGGWIKWADSVDAIPMSKGDTNGGTESYGLFLTGASGILTASVANGVNDSAIDANDAIVSGTKSFVLMWVTATDINIKINAGTTATGNNGFPRSNASDPGGSLTFFDNGDSIGGLGTKCVLDEWFFCKNPADMTTALSTISANIYNGGNGIRFKDVLPADKTTIGLVSWWTMDEASGATRVDAVSGNDLFKTGTITQVSPLIP